MHAGSRLLCLLGLLGTLRLLGPLILLGLLRPGLLPAKGEGCSARGPLGSVPERHSLPGALRGRLRRLLWTLRLLNGLCRTCPPGCLLLPGLFLLPPFLIIAGGIHRTRSKPFALFLDAFAAVNNLFFPGSRLVLSVHLYPYPFRMTPSCPFSPFPGPSVGNLIRLYILKIILQKRKRFLPAMAAAIEKRGEPERLLRPSCIC